MRHLKMAILILFMAIFCSSKLSATNKLDEKEDDKKEYIVNISPQTFQKETAKGLVFVDFWAPWCGPCRRMNPILKEIAEEQKDKVKIAKLNIDDYKDFAIQMQVSALPTIVVYKDGVAQGRIAGLQTKEILLEVVESLSAPE